MTTDLGRLLEALRRALLNSVAPELNTDFARGQLAAIHDILGKLTRMAVWDPRALQAEAETLHQGNLKFVRCLENAGATLPPAGASAVERASPEGPLTSDQAAELNRAETRVRQLIDWLDTQRGSLPTELTSELDAILQHALREQLRVQRQRIPFTDFGAMTAAATKD